MHVITNRFTWLLALVATVSSSGTLVLADDPKSTSFGAFALVIPDGWTRVDADRNKTAAMLLFNGTAWFNADAMIKIDVGKPTARSAMETAKALAGADGKVFDVPVSVDGIDAIKVETTSTDMSRPKCAIVFHREGKVYLIMGAEKKGKRVSEALDQMVKSWKWSEAE
jgi:hypothetical protein